MMSMDDIKKYAKIELAKREFFYFCNLMAPDFYKKDREYLINVCNTLQNFYVSNDDILILCLPPRHGKSRSAVLFTQWLLGKNKNIKIMTGSYNEILSVTFSKNVRNAIQEEKADKDKIVYSDIFPGVKIKKGDGAMNLWSLEGGYNNYLATSPSGTATGFGANLMLIDDIIKNAEEAFNETTLEKHWTWLTSTMLSRLEEKGKIIIIMTRWASNDLAGRAMDYFKDKKMQILSMKAQQDDESMLCSDVLSLESYHMKIKAMGEEIASANYQQIPINSKGALYKNLKTYIDVPKDENGNALFTRIISYCDTADQGDDYLCNIIAGEYNKEAYVLDVYYTKDAMEITEIELARRLREFNVNVAYIESNNGGRGFARSVEKILYEQFDTRKCVISWFSQNKNKKARILANASWIINHMYFVTNWRDKYPEFYNSMISYQKEGKNKHDDAQDAVTGVCEKIEEQDAILFA